jgi:hypothetical protein
MFCAGRFGGSKSFGEHEPSPSVHARASPATAHLTPCAGARVGRRQQPEPVHELQVAALVLLRRLCCPARHSCFFFGRAGETSDCSCGGTTAGTAVSCSAASAHATAVPSPASSTAPLHVSCSRCNPWNMYTTPVRVCKECSLKCQRAEALVRAISQGNADLVQVRHRTSRPTRPSSYAPAQRYVSLGQNSNFFVGFFPPITLAASMGRGDIVALLLQVQPHAEQYAGMCLSSRALRAARALLRRWRCRTPWCSCAAACAPTSSRPATIFRRIASAAAAAPSRTCPRSTPRRGITLA